MCSRFRLTAIPPFRPAARASLESNSCAVPFACAARPPLLAISFCLPWSMDANPRALLRLLLLLLPTPLAPALEIGEVELRDGSLVTLRCRSRSDAPKLRSSFVALFAITTSSRYGKRSDVELVLLDQCNARAIPAELPWDPFVYSCRGEVQRAGRNRLRAYYSRCPRPPFGAASGRPRAG